MHLLLKFSAVIDAINEKIGVVCNWLVLLACIVSGGNAMVRYAYDQSSNAWLEVQWYMFAVIVMFGAAYTLKRNEHVRVDIFYMTLSRRGQLWIDILGTLVFLLPICLVPFVSAWVGGALMGSGGWAVYDTVMIACSFGNATLVFVIDLLSVR